MTIYVFGEEKEFRLKEWGFNIICANVVVLECLNYNSENIKHVFPKLFGAKFCD